MPTSNPFPITIPLKVNSPELLAFFQQRGEEEYLSAEEINTLVQAVNFLFENIGGGSLNISGITTLGTITIDGDQGTFSDFAWRYQGTDYAQVAPIVRTIPFASPGMYRTHTAYFTTTNDIGIAVGEESEEVTTEPNIPEGTLRMRAFNVFGEAITTGPGESLPYDINLLDELLDSPEPENFLLINVSGIDFKIKWETILSSLGPTSSNIAKGNFTGVFDMSTGINNFYNDYLEGPVVTLSLSATKSLGTICKVRIKGNLLNQLIPVDWIFRGQAFSSSSNKLNDILIMYVNDNEVILVNELVDYNAQQFPNNFSLEKAWHKLDVATTTETGGLVVSASDSLLTTPYNLTTFGSVVRSIQNLKECVSLDNSYLLFGTEINSVFQNSFSVSMKIKLDDGRPPATRYLCMYRITAASRFWIDYRTDGKITIAYTSNGVTCFAQTLNSVFVDGAMSTFNHLVVTVQSGGFIKIYYNGNLVPLSASLAGNMASVNMSLFLTSSNLYVGYDAGSNTYSKMFIKDLVIQDIVYDVDMIASLLNMP